MSDVITRNTRFAKKQEIKRKKRIKASGSIYKQTITTAILWLLLEIIFTLIGGEIISLGIFAGLGLGIGGGIMTFTHSYASGIFGGLMLLLFGIIILWVNIKDIWQSIVNENK